MSYPIKVAHSWSSRYFPCEGAQKVYLLVELSGVGKIKSTRAPVNVGLVLDRSGSMTGKPLEYSRKACQYVTEQMSAEDLLSMVAFDNEVVTVFAPEKATHKDWMKKKIDSIEARGSTNLSGGLIQGAQHVAAAKQEGTVNRVLLLSDGHANQGITDKLKLARIAGEYRSLGIGISTMGVGHGFDEDLMETIADGGGGNFYYIEKPDDIPDIFAKELQGVLSVLAQNVRMELIPSETARITNVFGYKSVGKNGGVEFGLGDLYDQEVKSILIEIDLFPHDVGHYPVLKLKLEYVDVTESVKACVVEMSVSAEFTDQAGLLSLPKDAAVEKQVKITETALAIEKAIHAFDSGHKEAGRSILQDQVQYLRRRADVTDDAELREQADMLSERLNNMEDTPMALTRKALHSQKYMTMKRKK